MAAILKMAAIFVRGRIWDVPICKNHQLSIVYLWTKFHACFIKSTILPNIAAICCTMTGSRLLEPKIFRNFQHTPRFLTTVIFATVTISTYFNIKFLIIIINVINPQLNNIVYRPVLLRTDNMIAHLCAHPGVSSAPSRWGALQKSGGA